MDLVFSWFADAGAWPEHPGSGCAVVDQEVVGPLRLLDHVETMLGLGRPDVSAVRRIAVYQRKVAAAGAKRFWSASFNLDPWSSTRELLGWRDELVEAGWRPGVGIERTRLADIAAAEEAGPALPFGRADRVRAVIDALGERPSLSLRSVRLVDDRSSLLAGWRALLEALERCGTLIEQLPEQAAASLEDGRLDAPYRRHRTRGGGGADRMAGRRAGRKRGLGLRPREGHGASRSLAGQSRPAAPRMVGAVAAPGAVADPAAGLRPRVGPARSEPAPRFPAPADQSLAAVRRQPARERRRRVPRA